MTENRKLLYACCALLVLLLGMTACRGRRTIPEGTMRAIMREAFLSEAAARHHSDPSKRRVDSMDFHSPILNQYGYTLDDFRYTIDKMASRKSNPLDNILAGVTADIQAYSEVAEARFRQMKSVDSIALSRAADTVFRSDTVLRGKLDGYKFSYSQPQGGDSVVPAGVYRIQFLYSTGNHARAYTKSVRYRRIGPSGSGAGTASNLWIPVARDTVPYSGDISVGANVRRLDIELHETQRPGTEPDTSYLTRVRLVYVPSVTEARQRLYEQLTGFYPTLEDLYYERYIQRLQEAGSALFAGPGR